MKKIFPKFRKGQMFTILAILLIGLMFASFEIFSTIHERNAIKTRISTMNSFLNSIEKNLQRQLYISGFRIIFLADSKIINGTYISNLTSFFNEAFYNGTVNGGQEIIMMGATYNDTISSINKKASKINVNVYMENTTLEFKQDGPWNVRFTMVSDFVMEDKQKLARWKKKQNISVLVPVEGFLDPIFIVGGHYMRKINRTIYEGNYASPGDLSNLSDHVDKGYYAANPDAPSFLNRLEGNFSGDTNGIESFVNTLALPPELQNNEKTCIDHLYFDPDPDVDVLGGAYTGMQTWFKIDEGHLLKYNLTTIPI